MSTKMQSNLQNSFVFAGCFHNQSLMLGVTASTVVRGQITTKFSCIPNDIYEHPDALAVSISRLIETHLLFHLYLLFNFRSELNRWSLTMFPITLHLQTILFLSSYLGKPQECSQYAIILYQSMDSPVVNSENVKFTLTSWMHRITWMMQYHWLEESFMEGQKIMMQTVLITWVASINIQ